jgi:hypothetical protein
MQMILTTEEAMQALNYTTVDEMPGKVSTILLPAVDNFIENATGKDWGTLTEKYTSIDPVAKIIAGVLLVRWFDDPGLIGQVSDVNILSLLGQLAAKATQEKQAAEGV